MEDEDDWGKEEEICGRLVRDMTHEEWKIVNRVVEGVEIKETSRLQHKGTNRGKEKKGMRELRGLQSSINYERKSRKDRELNVDR